MKINFKVRLKNKTFCVTMATLIISFVYQVLAAFDLFPQVSQDTVVNIITICINVLATIGVLVDPTTEGFNDSERAMTYGTDKDERSEG